MIMSSVSSIMVDSLIVFHFYENASIDQKSLTVMHHCHFTITWILHIEIASNWIQMKQLTFQYLNRIPFPCRYSSDSRKSNSSSNSVLVHLQLTSFSFVSSYQQYHAKKTLEYGIGFLQMRLKKNELPQKRRSISDKSPCLDSSLFYFEWTFQLTDSTRFHWILINLLMSQVRIKARCDSKKEFHKESFLK